MDGSCQIPKLLGYNIDPKISAVLREKTHLYVLEASMCGRIRDGGSCLYGFGLWICGL